MPITLYACAACMSLSLCVCMNMWICANDCVCGFFCLGTSLHLSQYVGVVAIVPWLGSVSKCNTGRLWAGLAAPSPRKWLPGQEGCSFSSFTPSPPSVPSPSAPPIQVVPDHLPPTLFPEPSLPPPPLPSLPTPPFPTCPRSILHGRPQCAPAPVWPGPNAVSFPL